MFPLVGEELSALNNSQLISDLLPEQIERTACHHTRSRTLSLLHQAVGEGINVDGVNDVEQVGTTELAQVALDRFRKIACEGRNEDRLAGTLLERLREVTLPDAWQRRSCRYPLRP